MRALAFEHLDSDPIGVFGDVLSERGIEVDRVRLHDGEPVPDWRGYDLVIAMGAGASVWQEDRYPWIVEEKRAVREAVLGGVPYFGVCFGVQLLADAFGARSFRGPEPEIGVNQVFLTPAARHDPVFRGFPSDLEVCEWHSNHFSLPPGAVRLARSPRYENQAIRYGRVAYGIQSHLEPSVEDIRDWLSDGSDVVFEKRHGEGAVARLLEDYAQFVPFLQETGRQVFGRWLQNALAFGTTGPQAPAQRAGRGPGAQTRTELVGRETELARVDGAIAAARFGESAVLVVRGDPGTGKTAMLQAAADRAHGLNVVRTTGELDSETGEPFAALADLCRPFANRRDELPAHRAAAAASILDSGAGAPVRDRFAVYAAAFDLLVRSAAATPLLLLVDDAHLLDSGSREAISFIAGRLGADGIALLIATESDEELPSAAELRLGGLQPPDAHSLLEQHSSDELAPSVAEAVVAAAGGNPLALREIPVELSPAQRAGAEALPDPLPSTAEWSFLKRISALPAPVRQALVVAALAGPRDQDAILAGGRKMGLDDRVWDPAQASGLIRRENGALRFIHPLARLVASYSALRDDRRAAHEALGELTSGDSRIWHRARAAAVPDEEVAAGLEQIAVRARDRTAFAAAAQTLERAARLTPDDEARARRLLDAARAARLAGHVTGALDHVDAALRHAVAEEQRGAAERLRGQILARGGSAALARDQLLAVAGRYERSDPAEASEMLADAVLPTLRAGNPGEAVRLARRADRLGESAGGAAPAVRVALGTALVFAGEFTEGRALLDTAAENADEAAEAQQLANLGAGLELAGRHDAARRMLTSVIDDARASGAISILPYALIRLADVHVETGHWSAASAALHEAALLADEMGQAADRGLALGALAWLSGARGQAEDCHALAEQALQIAGRLGGGARLDRAGTAIGMLDLGRGQPDAAIPNLEIACRLQDEQGWSDAARTPHRRPELIEAYALAGRHDEARSALELFRLDAERTERPSALAAWQRGRLALAEAGELDATYAAACAAGAEVWGPFDRARGELLYGTRLVEAGRTDDALSPLACALSAFEDLEARSWTDRARGAILAAGGSIPEPRLSRTERLTPQELEVAAAAADGLSAAEIAERQILGPRTVQMRLASAAIKLGLESPAELAGALRGEPAVAPAR